MQQGHKSSSANRYFPPASLIQNSGYLHSFYGEKTSIYADSTKLAV